jgi:hypothetical protein
MAPSRYAWLCLRKSIRGFMKMNDIDEMKVAADLVAHEHFMGMCEGGFPLIAFEERCRFCGATDADRCKRNILGEGMTK